MTEAELAQKFIDYFDDGFEIYKEVPAGGIVDIVLVDGFVRVALEVKTSLNFDVIWQAHSRRPYFHYTYAAVPVKHRRLHPAQEALCKHLGIGVLCYYELNTQRTYAKNANRFEIFEAVKPRMNRKIYK